MRVHLCLQFLHIGTGFLPASHNAAADLMKSADVLNKGYTLFVDNWYTSPTLFHWLQGRKTNACGTVRPNRKWMPKDFEKLKMNKVSVRSMPTGMMCLKWVDKKPIHILSKMHTSELVEIQRVNRQGQQVMKPQAIIDYNDGMKGVDVGDQLASSYPAVRRSLKWYKKVLMYLFEMAMINAFALYKEVGGQTTHQLTFREDVVRGLLQEYLPQAPRYSGRGRPAITNSLIRLQGRNPHVIREIEGKKYKRCHLMSSRDFLDESIILEKKSYFQGTRVFKQKAKPMSSCLERGLPHRPSVM
ncbi:piggyBac transposable element-derived protein 4-like [Penaeus japonicus]|uniref:piggyBac transposable element-derived protein 4-like n=1 Tax=Penaeus japonicus TaxID=27405 RepID=UPI001C711B91|nr:piggyBac transposable element-derived protein 4-like [Penaeus japonicus]